MGACPRPSSKQSPINLDTVLPLRSVRPASLREAHPINMPCFGIFALLWALDHSTPTQAYQLQPQRRDDFLFQAYDCGSPLAIKDVANNHQANCAQQTGRTSQKDVSYTLLQHERELKYPGHLCIVRITQTVMYCGVFDHQTAMPTYQYFDKVIPLTVQQCRQAVDSGTLPLNGRDFTVLVPGIKHYNHEIVGRTYYANEEVKCEGGTFKPPGHEATLLKDVVVSHHIQFIIEPEQILQNTATGGVHASNNHLDLPCSSG